jgi:phosphoglycolate phosphatase
LRHTLLMFDVDLTLVDADGAGQRAMLKAAAQVCSEGFTFEGVAFAGRLDPLIFADAVAKNSSPGSPDDTTLHDRFREAYTRELKALITDNGHRVRALSGGLDRVTLLHRRASEKDDVMLGLLTGNYAQTAKIKIEAAGLNRDWFVLSCFGDEADSRPDLAALAMTRYAQATGTPPDPRRVVIIGDTPHDVACAKAHGCTAFAVATGRSSREALHAAGADIVVNDLTDPAPLLELIN